jgi:hypothetical protein
MSMFLAQCVSILSLNLQLSMPWVGALQQAFPSLNYTAKMFRADPSHGTTCHSQAAVGALTLVLCARVANNNPNLGLCQAAVAQFIFWREYLSNAEKQEGVCGRSQVSLDLCTSIGCHVVMATSPSVEHHVLGTGSSQSHIEREQGSSATVLLDCCNLS